MDSNNILYNLGLKQIDDAKKLEKEQTTKSAMSNVNPGNCI